MDKEAPKKALKLLLSLDTEIAINKTNLVSYYSFLTQALLKNKKIDLTYQNYKTTYESGKFDEKYLVDLKHYKKIQLAAIYLQQNKFKKAVYILLKLKTDSAYYGQLIRRLKSKLL
jgi:hypothetical protein